MYSHTIYRTKHENDQNLQLKAGTAPLGNGDDAKKKLKKSFSTCALIGLPTIKSIAFFCGRTIYK